MVKSVSLGIKIAELKRTYHRLQEIIDPGIWWPAESRFEIFLGSILTQNTAWHNVEKSLNRLKSRDLANPLAIVEVSNKYLQDLIRPSGFMTAKSTNLQNIARWFIARDTQAQQMDTACLRQELLAQSGVGEETADTLLLYAYRRPVFIYDSYARRMLKIIGLGDYKTYAGARRALNQGVNAIGFTQRELADFHSLIVEAGKIMRRQGDWPL